MASRIVRDPTAFASSSTRRKHPRKQDKAYLEWLRMLPCVISARRPVEAAHIRYAAPEYGKRETGGAEKADDRFALPLHPDLHREQHSMNEREFWQRSGIDPIPLCLALHDAYQDDDDEKAAWIVRAANLRALQRPA